MRRNVMIWVVLALVVALIATPVMAGKPSDCTRIQDGVLTYSAGHYLEGEPLETGYDIFGYNYQSHLFNGSYANTYLGGAGFPPYCGDDEAYEQRLIDEEYTSNPYGAWYWPYRDVQLMMKWNDAWLSNRDCDGDEEGKLDRHYGFPSYIGSGAWLTNHMRGVEVDEDTGEREHWVYFVKIVAAPADAVKIGNVWYAADGTEIGPVIWGEFAIIQQVDSGLGATYVSPSGPGLGKW